MAASLWPEPTTGLVTEDTFDRRMGAPAAALTAPDEWEPWLRSLFPRAVRYPFAPHHRQFWGHIWAIGAETAPRPFIGIWAREGGKSTNVELASVALGARGRRRYGVYVRRTQDRADDSVTNIVAKLESNAIERYYPEHARPLLSKFGQSRGWRRNRLRTAGGLTVDAIGLDVAARGAKIEDDRPDFIILDDMDEEMDTPAATARKILVLTTAILPAGSENCAIIGIQNLIIADGVFSQLADGRGEFLTDRIVSGPHPAVEGLEWEWRENAETGTREPVIIAGTPTWEGQSLQVCARQMRTWGPVAFELEAQHKIRERAEGLALHFDAREHYVDWIERDIVGQISVGRSFGGIDFGAWRFGFSGWVADEHGVVTRWGELFSQREELRVRAQALDDLCVRVGLIVGKRLVKPFPLWGDVANTQDITELNAAFKAIESPLRVVAVGADAKFRRPAVERINEKLGERVIRLVRRPLGTNRWLLGYHAGSPGREMKGSRLAWEIEHWSYPVPRPGKVDLKQDPDDHSADGGDLIASMRYALMSWWKPAKPPDDDDFDAWSPEVLEAEAATTWKQRRTRQQRAFTRHHEEDE